MIPEVSVSCMHRSTEKQSGSRGSRMLLSRVGTCLHARSPDRVPGATARNEARRTVPSIDVAGAVHSVDRTLLDLARWRDRVEPKGGGPPKRPQTPLRFPSRTRPFYILIASFVSRVTKIGMLDVASASARPDLGASGPPRARRGRARTRGM